MKKIIAILLVIVICFAFLIGCSSNGPSEQQMAADIVEQYFGGESNTFRNLKVEEVILADTDGDTYYAKLRTSYESSTWRMDLGIFVWFDEEEFIEVEYKHYDVGGWVLQDVSTSYN